MRQKLKSDSQNSSLTAGRSGISCPRASRRRGSTAGADFWLCCGKVAVNTAFLGLGLGLGRSSAFRKRNQRTVTFQTGTCRYSLTCDRDVETHRAFMITVLRHCHLFSKSFSASLFFCHSLSADSVSPTLRPHGTPLLQLLGCSRFPSSIIAQHYSRRIL
jgi:hypothetical protein